MSITLPISALVATRDRFLPLKNMLESLAAQSVQPEEIIVVDGSEDSQTEQLCQSKIEGLDTQIFYYQATELGAATQRNRAMQYATQNTIWLLDDDIIFEPMCLERIWQALYSNPKLGGVNAMITNQKYSTPGKISRKLFHLLHGKPEPSYAGKCIGPALNLLPEDRPDLPEVVPVEWINSGCTLYRREALPQPLFPSVFTGYSLMEDLCLSLTVGKKWQLANVRTARIYHDSQPGVYKSDRSMLAQMELVNRHYIMTHVLERRAIEDYLKLSILQLFEVTTNLFSWQGLLNLPKIVWGKMKAVLIIIRTESQAVSANK